MFNIDPKSWTWFASHNVPLRQPIKVFLITTPVSLTRNGLTLVWLAVLKPEGYYLFPRQPKKTWSQSAVSMTCSSRWHFCRLIAIRPVAPVATLFYLGPTLEPPSLTHSGAEYVFRLPESPAQHRVNRSLWPLPLRGDCQCMRDNCLELIQSCRVGYRHLFCNSLIDSLSE